MAKEKLEELEEEFITLDDDEDEEELASEDSTQELIDEAVVPESSNKLLYILITAFTVLAFAMLGFLYYLYLQKQDVKEEATSADAIIETIQNKKSPTLKVDSYQERINAAKVLFKTGKKEEALVLYDALSQYNKALSFYNSGVGELKKGHYDKAIVAFLKSYTQKELHFESALNIAIAAYDKGDGKLFKQYLADSVENVHHRVSSPLYSYYRFLLDYYRGFYAEALVPLHHPTSSFYQKEQNALLAKLYTAFNNPTKAIQTLEKDGYAEDFFTLGLLYAKQGEYTLAQKYLEKVALTKASPLHPNLSLALVYLKMGLYKKSADLLNPLRKRYKEKSTLAYPINVHLKETLFDPVAAQKAFQKNLFFNARNTYSLIFYFAPYQLMNPKQSIDNIHQGAKNIYINALTPAFNNLEKSKHITDANIAITRGIKAALKQNLYKAKDIFLDGIKSYPSSAPLHYNLALTYAKLYDFQKAYKHFKHSSVLDINNYYAPIFSKLCARLLLKNNDKTDLNQLEDKLYTSSNTEDKKRLLTLISVVKEDIRAVDLNIQKSTFDDALVIIMAQIRQDFSLYQIASDRLMQKVPQDIIANILSLDAHHDKQDIKSYAKVIQDKLTQESLDFTPLYTGHAFVKELYIELLNIAGVVPKAKKIFEARLAEKGPLDISSLQALAYADIYLKEFDQAYAIYNQLIDTHKQQDSNTLFLAAIASIGAKHHENAIALLELAKLTNESNIESRFALGILYHETKNIEGAAIQYAKIGDSGFTSRYFSFSLAKTLLK